MTNKTKKQMNKAEMKKAKGGLPTATAAALKKGRAGRSPAPSLVSTADVSSIQTVGWLPVPTWVEYVSCSHVPIDAMPLPHDLQL